MRSSVGSLRFCGGDIWCLPRVASVTSTVNSHCQGHRPRCQVEDNGAGKRQTEGFDGGNVECLIGNNGVSSVED